MTDYAASFEFYLLSLPISIFWHLIWYLRFRITPIDCDYGQNAYYGYFWRQDHDAALLGPKAFNIGFKGGLYSLFALSYILKPEWYSPRLLFAFWNSLTALVLTMTFPETAGPLPLLLFLALSTAPFLGATYLAAEFWAMLPTSCLLLLCFSPDFPGKSVLFGVLLLINPLAFKLTYLTESLVFFILYPGNKMIILAVWCAILGVLLGFKSTRKPIMALLASLFSGTLFRYTAQYERHSLAKMFSVFRLELCMQFFPLIILISLADIRVAVLLLAQFAAGCIQMRFYRIHFVLMIPLTAFLAARAELPLTLLALAPPLLFSLKYWLAADDEKLDWRINKSIIHYHKRNIASKILAEWLNSHDSKAETLLVVGETPQLNILTGKRSPCDDLNFEPAAIATYPQLTELLLKQILRNPPELLAVMRDCLDWKYFGEVTGLRYQLSHAIVVGDETFPLYRLSRKECPNPDAVGELFLPCRHITATGNKIWNKTLPNAPHDMPNNTPDLPATAARLEDTP